MLLSYLAHTYHVRRDTAGGEGRRGVIINRMFGEMYNLRAVASILVATAPRKGLAATVRADLSDALHAAASRSEPGFLTLHLDLIAATVDLLAQAVRSEAATGSTTQTRWAASTRPPPGK